MLRNRCITLVRGFNYKILHGSNKLIASKAPHSTATSATTRNKQDAEEIDAPVRYTTSPASRWKASVSRSGVQTRLWYEPYVILASLTVFLIYFGILREENDVDQELTQTLYSRIQGLEEHQLRMSLEYNREKNLDTTQIVQRLKEIEKERANVE